MREGDLVVSVVGTLGRSVEIDGKLDGANLNRALARVQLRPDVPRSLVRFWFGSSPFQDQARLATSSDSAQPTLGLGDLKNFPLGFPEERSAWSNLAAALEETHADIRSAVRRISKQVELLQERRQGLITAVVTGELEVPGVAA